MGIQETNTTENREVVASVSNLGIAFGKNVVLDDFSIKLYKGENLVILGRSGSGKSVLIKCIIGLLTPDTGQINVLGKEVLNLDIEELDMLRAEIGFLFQSNALYDSMTVKENLEFPMRRHLRHLETEEANERILEALNNVGLSHTIDMMPSELSGGMQKRIALARTLILKPKIILYDEPTTGLDPITGKEITTLMMQIQEKYQTSSIIISHDMKCVQRTSDRIAILLKGKDYAEGVYDKLKQSEDPNIKQFFE